MPVANADYRGAIKASVTVYFFLGIRVNLLREIPREATMKVLLICAGLIVSVLLISSASSVTRDASAQGGKKPPETILLSKEAKLGPVAFNHSKHFAENRSVDGTRPIACVECHHTAQPASDALKHPPHKTVWPADRTTTLTAELLDENLDAPAVNVCTDCHARVDTKPKLLPEIPSLKYPGSDEPTVLTNQQAFHRNCAGCHDEVVKARPNLDPWPPTSKKCTTCHKKTAT